MNNHVCLLVCVSFLTGQAQAQERIYSTVDAQGRVQVIKDDSVKKTQVEAKALESQAADKQGAINKEINKYELDGEEYIDAEVEEKKQAQQKAKKRFYFVPTGALGEKVVESEQVLVTTPVKKDAEAMRLPLKFSPEYQQLSKDWLLSKQQFLSSYCQYQKKLKSISDFKEKNSLSGVYKRMYFVVAGISNKPSTALY